MTSTKDSTSRNLSSFCQDRSSFKTKFALLSFYKIKFSPWTDSIILLLEYLQLISQIILSPSTNYDSPGYNTFFFNIVVYFFKIINPSYLLTYHESDTVTSTVLVILFCFTMLKLTLFGYILLASLWDYRIDAYLSELWKWIFKLQARVTYFLLTSFWVKAIIEAREGDFRMFGLDETGLIVLSSIALVIEFFFSFVLKFQFSYVLPTENLLSSKNNELELITLVQKLIIQVAAVIFSSNAMTSAWVTSSIGLILSGIRELQFTRNLPLYHFKALVLQRGLLGMVISLNVVYFLQTILRETSYEGADINFVILTWVVIALLSIKGGHENLKARFLGLLCANTRGSPELLLHKVYATEQIKFLEIKPGRKSSKYHWTHLVMNHQRIKIQDIFGLKRGTTTGDFDMTPEKMNRVFLLYFEDLLAKFPKNFLIKLHLAYICLKNAEPYAKTVKVATQLEQNKWSAQYLSSSLLLNEIENSMLKDQQNFEEEELDFCRYLQSKRLMEGIRKKMLKQTNLYLKVCQNILGDTANIEDIYSSAQIMSDLKTKIQKRINKASKTYPEHYISPLLCYAKYYLIVNHQTNIFEKYCEHFSQSYFKFEKFYKESTLVEENLYQDSNVFLLISTEKGNYGKILFCNSSILSICGGNNVKGYANTQISRLFSPSIQPFYEQLAKESELLNKKHRTFLFHKERFLVEAEFCLKYHPYLTQGLCLDMIIRPILVTTEYMVLKEDGGIEGASRSLFKILKLNDVPSDTTLSSVSIKLLSKELYKINAVFNMVSKREDLTQQALKIWEDGVSPRSKNMTDDKMLEIYNAFIAGNQKVQIYPYKKDAEGVNKKEPYVFFAQVRIVKFGNTALKVVSLRPATTHNDSIQKSESFEFETEEERHKKMKKMIKLFSMGARALGKLNAKKIFEPRIEEEEEEEEDVDYLSENLKKEEDKDGSENMSLDEQDNYVQQITLFERQSSPTLPTSPGLPTALLQTQADLPLLSPASEGRNLLLGEGMISSFRNRTDRTQRDSKQLTINAVVDRKVEALSSSENLFDEEGKGKNDTKFTKEMIHRYKASQHSSQKSGDKPGDKAFKAAIITKSYPRSFIILCVFFYGVVLITFIAQIIMKSVSDTTMSDLQIKKNLMKLSQDRSYKAALLHLLALGGNLQLTGALQSGGVFVGMDDILSNCKLRIRDMKAANDQMLQYVYSLDKEFQDLLFIKDVEIIGTYLDSNDTTSKEVNTFQATQEFASGVRTIVGLDNAVSQQGLNVFDYFGRNIANDYQWKNVEITDIFVSSVDKQKDSYRQMMNLCLVLTPFLLAGIGIILIFIIWNQHRIEKKNLKAFIKINPKGVRDISEQLMKFRKSLLNDESFESKWFSNNSEDFEIMPEFEQSSAYSKRHSTQIIKYEEFRKRYLRYIFRVVFYIFILVAITIWDLISTQKNISVIYNRQGQLQFANYIGSQVQGGYSAFNMLFFTNDTMKVLHQKPSVALLAGMDIFEKIQAEIPSRLVETDKSYNPDVKEILYNNNPSCEGFPPDNIYHCQNVVSKGQPVNLMVLLSAFQDWMKIKYQDYLAVPKTNMSVILVAANKNLDTVLSTFITIAYEAQMISDIMNETLDEKISENKHARTTIIIIFSISLVVISVIIWIDILRVIRDVYNDFKKVLQILPPNLVLSSYLLKKFLQTTTSSQLLFNN